MTVCAMHGGKTPSGLASPHFKTGRYSKSLPVRLVERYQSALQDEELLALHHEIALLDTRLADLLSRVDTGESGAAWALAGKAYRDLKAAMSAVKIAEAQDAMLTLETILGEAATDYSAWLEIQELVQQRRALVTAEAKRQIDARNMITSEQALVFVGAIAGIIKARINDPTLLAAIQADINDILVQRTRAQALAE